MRTPGEHFHGSILFSNERSFDKMLESGPASTPDRERPPMTFNLFLTGNHTEG